MYKLQVGSFWGYRFGCVTGDVLISIAQPQVICSGPNLTHKNCTTRRHEVRQEVWPCIICKINLFDCFAYNFTNGLSGRRKSDCFA